MQREEIIDIITGLTEPLAVANGLEVWGVEAGMAGPKTVIRVFLESASLDEARAGEGRDAAQGVTVGQCAKVSKGLSAALDVEDVIPGAYTLEVSSPGMDRKFFRPGQMVPYVGRKIRVELREPRDGSRKMTERLTGADDQGFTLDISDETVRLAWDEVKTARLVHED